MSMKEFIESLTLEQKAEFYKALQEDKETVQPTVNAEKSEPKVEIGDDFVVRRLDKHGDEVATKRRPVRGGENTWVDTGEDRNEDTVTPEFKPVARSRPAVRKVQKECIACGKSVEVNPAIVYGEFYRCDKCGGKR